MLALVLLLSGAMPAIARHSEASAAGGVLVAPDSPRLTPDYWIGKLANPSHPILDRAAIAAQNARMAKLDAHIEDIAALPDTLPGTEVAASIAALSTLPAKPLYDVAGKPLAADALHSISDAVALEAVPATLAPRYGLVVERADLRAFPTTLRVFTTPGDIDIDRFQESALFPGDPVAVLHESRDGRWWFVASQRYRAWIEKERVALGDKAQVFGYSRRTPYLVVTGATARTVFTPDRPAVSALQLDMGVRVPVLADWPADAPVNGQHPYTAHVIELPVRDQDGRLAFAPALLPRTADTAPDYLPLAPATLLRQGFKFLGERYGWGHSYGTRDCSGFVSEIYRSAGVLLPRNTSAQAVSPALDRIAFAPGDDHARRMAVVRELQVGDLVYIPGHVMMVIGHDAGLTWVIHDTSGTSYRDASSGRIVRTRLNGVSVTPLEPLLFNETQGYVDRITNIQRIRP